VAKVPPAQAPAVKQEKPPAKPPAAAPEKPQPKREEAKVPQRPAREEGPPPRQMVTSLSEIKIHPGMVYVPQGKSKLRGAEGTAGGPYHLEVADEPQYLDAFFIDRCEVSNEQYAKFVGDTGYSPPKYWRGGEPPEGREKCPVTCVTYNDADAFAKWAGKRLPTALEWEKAGRGQEGFEYPWGNEWDKWKAQTLYSLDYKGDDRIPWRRWLDQWRKTERGREARQLGGMTVPVDRFEEWASPFKCLNMIGNVAEWTSSIQRTEPDLTGGQRVYRVVCGGAWTTALDEFLTTYGSREFLPEEAVRDDLGFRCALDAPNIQGGASALKKPASPQPEQGKETAAWPKDEIERDYARFYKPLNMLDLSGPEAVQKAGGQIFGNVTFGKGRTGPAAIMQDPSAFVLFRQKMPVENGGIEFWLRMPPAEAQGVILAGVMGKMSSGGFSVVLLPEGGLSFAVEHGAEAPPIALKDRTIGQPQKWVHVAVQWGQRKHRIYINGKLRQQDNAVLPLPANLRGFAIGAPHAGQELCPLGFTAQPITIGGIVIFGSQ
jgi:formylglycine-generating enzyme required for sulfatase activity